MWTWWCTHSACWLAGRSHRIPRRAKHPSVWRNAKSPRAHAAPAPHLLPHPSPQFGLSTSFHLPHSDPLQPTKNAPRLVTLLLLWGGGACWRNSRVLLASSTAQNASFHIFTSFSVKTGNYLLILSGIRYEWWNLLPHWCELLSHQCLNPCEWKLISIPVPPTRSCIRRTTFHPAWDLCHFLLPTLHPPLHT